MLHASRAYREAERTPRSHRIVNRLRDVLSGYFPALERAFDYAHSRVALVLLTGYQIPAAIRCRTVVASAASQPRQDVSSYVVQS